VPVHLTHWGAFEATSNGTRITSVQPWNGDPNPNPLRDNVASAQHHPARVLRPAVRAGWLKHRSGAGRGDEPFVELEWDEALDLLAGELADTYREAGPSSVYGASYGWASAGRFHHAQSQVHRFLNVLGGYVSARGDYSHGCSDTLMPHVIGMKPADVMVQATSWEVIAEHTELFLAFGGLSAKNSFVGPGGIARHVGRSATARSAARGCRFVSISPIADDTFQEAGAEWLAPRPGTDAALMLALAFVLETEGLADRAAIEAQTTGYDRFRDYLVGADGGPPKSPEWSEAITGIDAERVRRLAREMAASRTMINLSWSLQRQQHGEQPIWLGITLAAMLGEIGRPGGGFAHGYGATADIGLPLRVASAPSLSQGRNAESTYIPVARVADMLLHPGETYDFNGQRLIYPQIDLVYWCGGNPFHHAQDLSRLRRAFTRPRTVVVHEQFWTATARHADIVLPATMSIERDDFGAGRNDPIFFPMPALTSPAGEARDDYAIFAALAERLGKGAEFTEGRTVQQWLRHLYGRWQDRLASKGHRPVDFDEFWASEHIEIPVINPRQVLMKDFRADPEANPLNTPSGKIEVFSAEIDSYGYADCPGHPVWLEPTDWQDEALRYPLHLIANQPATRLHSQLDVGATSQASKVAGREPVRMNPEDAERRGLAEGDVVRVRNDRGSCLAGLVLADNLAPGVVQLSTGAWYDPDPDDASFCRHGNPNVLTADRPTSGLTQATTGQHAFVEIERFVAPLPELRVRRAPRFTQPRPNRT
jgi:biotin/methionine sulfoxide reductase